jgi:uncharacterized lipoprotein YmbA
MKTILRTAAALAAVSCLAGCLGAPTPSSTLHTMSRFQAEPVPERDADAVDLFLHPVSVAPQLDRSQIVVVSPGDEGILVPLPLDRWASSLKDEAAHELWVAIERERTAYRVRPVPTRTPPADAATLRVVLLHAEGAFAEGRVAGSVHLVADCTLTRPGQSERHWVARFTRTPDAPTVSAYVDTLRDLLADLAASIPD